MHETEAVGLPRVLLEGRDAGQSTRESRKADREDGDGLGGSALHHREAWSAAAAIAVANSAALVTARNRNEVRWLELRHR